MAPVDVTSFDRRRPQAPAPLACATVENHIPALVREYMLEVQILFWLRARHDEDQVCHDRLRWIPDADSLQPAMHSRTDAERRRALGAGGCGRRGTSSTSDVCAACAGL